MRSLISASRKVILTGSVFLILLAFIPGPGAAGAEEPDSGWLWQPWIGTTGGYESDLILDPDFSRQVIPGGGFFELSPGFRLSRRLSDKTVFRLLNNNTVERFSNSDRRTLFATSLIGDLRFRSRSAFRARATLNADYFDDSGSASFQRLSGGGAVGAGAEFTRWGFEISAYLQGRRYPNVLAPAAGLTTQTYTEDHRGLGGYLILKLKDDLLLKGTLNSRTTDSVDPFFDSTSWTASGNLEYHLTPRTWLSANLVGQSRDFSNRIADEDNDSYTQAGVGLSRELASRANLSLRYSRATYSYALGGELTTDRFSAGVIWQFGKKSPAIRHRGGASLRAEFQPYTAAAPVRFRFHAPKAASVVLVGSFNGWNPKANPMRRTADGWWETSLALGSGTYEFLYLVDNTAVVPPDTVRTVPDGFGGRNGVLEVSPAPR